MTDSPRSDWTDLARPPLRAAALRAAVTADGGGPGWRRIEVVPRTGSTNADLAARAREGEPAGLVLVADHQSAGRGRLDRSWVAPPRASIAVSVLVDPIGVAERRLSWLPLLAGLAVADVLVRQCGLQARLKWPNDVLVPVPDDAAGGLRKVAGLLAELVARPAPAPAGVVLGAGMNVSQSIDELPVPTATSLLLAGSSTTDRDTVVRAYLRALDARYRTWLAAAGDPRASGLGPAYREACSTLGRRVEVHLPGAPALVGLAQEVDDDGRLVVLSDGVVHALAAGDVVHLRT